jgi:hypothetical protein
MFESFKIDFPIVKFWSEIENVSTVLLGLEEKLELAVRFSRVDMISPEWLMKSRTGTRHKATHGLAKLELKQKWRSRPIEGHVEAQARLM